MRRAFRLVGGALTLAVFAQTAFAQDYWAGLDAYLESDYGTALNEWLPLAEQGDASAQGSLGIMYANGEGVPKDDVEAARWYRLAAEQGLANSQNNLGVMYDMGIGVSRDRAEAVKWYRLAAKQGKAEAQFALGGMYAKGEGVPQNDLLAYMWSHLAAALGDTDAIHNRDVIATKLTPELLAEAQRMSRLCLESNYKKCDY